MQQEAQSLHSFLEDLEDNRVVIGGDFNPKMVNNANSTNLLSKKNNKGQNKEKNYIPSEIWEKMSKEEKKKFMDAKKKKKNSILAQEPTTPSNLPMQYNGHSMSNNAALQPSAVNPI